jgi:signal transduction histidine kinase
VESITGGQAESTVLRVLIVDDCEDDYASIRELFKKLRSQRYELDWADSSQEGLKRLREQSYDVCLLDHSIDDESGLTFLETVKKQDSGIPVILLSEGLSLDKDVAALRAGAADYLSKSRLQPGFLHRAIRFAVERRKSRTEAIEVEKQLLHSQQMKALGQLAASMAHDLNNALGAVVGHLDLIIMGTEDNPDLNHSAKVALDGCERASSLIEHILACSSQDSTLTPDVNLHEIVLETVDVLGRIIPPSVTITTSVNRTQALLINGNAAQIRQAIVNVALNAYEAMPDGGSLHFQFSIEDSSSLGMTSGKAVRLDIRDTGVGIASETLPRVFDPSFTTKNTGAGLGLGLSTVLAAMDNHRGKVEIDSSPGSGTSISLLFPLLDNSAREMRETERIEKVKAAVRPLFDGSKPKKKNTSQKGKVLLIEDEVTLVELLKLYLAAAGFETKEFCNPIHALEWYELHHDEIDLIVLDMIMPQLHGVECFDQLMDINPVAAIAICSGAFDDEVQTLLDRGALKFFQKPGRYPTMVTWIAETIAMRRAQQESQDLPAD